MFSEIAIVCCAVIALQASFGYSLPTGKPESTHIEINNPPIDPEINENDEEESYQVILQSPSQRMKIQIVEEDGSVREEELHVFSDELASEEKMEATKNRRKVLNQEEVQEVAVKVNQEEVESAEKIEEKEERMQEKVEMRVKNRRKVFNQDDAPGAAVKVNQEEVESAEKIEEKEERMRENVGMSAKNRRKVFNQDDAPGVAVKVNPEEVESAEKVEEKEERMQEKVEENEERMQEKVGKKRRKVLIEDPRSEELKTSFKCNWRRLYSLYIHKKKVQFGIKFMYPKERRKELRRAFKVICDNPEETISELLQLDE